MHESHRTRWSPRRSLSLASAGALVLATMPATLAAAEEHTEPRDTDFVCQEPYDSDFDDVDENVTHHENILCAADHEVAQGFEDDTYRPNEGVRRDQMASFIARLIEESSGEELEEGDEEFDDVDEDDTHYENIRKLANIEVALGFEDDTYRPREIVSRDQMASFVRRAISYLDNEEALDGSQPPDADQDHFDDTDGNTHEDAIHALAEQRIVVGDGEGTYGPGRDVGRGQMASFLMRGYDYAVEAGLVDPLGPTAQGAGTLSSDEINVLFDDGVEVTDVEGFRVYSDDECTEEVAHGQDSGGGGGPLINVELSAAMAGGEDHWFRLDARSVVDGDGFPNIESDCLEVTSSPFNGNGNGNDD